MNHSSEDKKPIHRKVDFEMWERLYGRSLSDEEKKEIRGRMSGFARLLIQEDLRQKKETHQKQIADLEKTAKVYGVEI